MLTPTVFNEVADKLTAMMLEIVPQDAYINVAGTSLTKYGQNATMPLRGHGDSLGSMSGNTIPTNDYGMLRRVRELRNLLLGINLSQSNYPQITVDYDDINYMLQAVNSMQATVPYQAIVRNLMSPVLQALANLCTATGTSLGATTITDIDSFATYYNTGPGGGTYGWQCPLNPDFITLYNACFSKSPSAKNVFAPTASGSVIGSVVFNPVAYSGLINMTEYAGSGTAFFAGCVSNNASGNPTNLTGNLSLNSAHGLATHNYVLVVYGSGIDKSNNTFSGGASGHYWTSGSLSVTNGVAFSNASIQLTPATAGDCLQLITQIQLFQTPFTQGSSAVQTPADAISNCSVSYAQPRAFASITA